MFGKSRNKYSRLHTSVFEAISIDRSSVQLWVVPYQPSSLICLWNGWKKEAIATAPLDLKPKLWRRYVDDVLEIIKKGTTENLTEHLNKVDPTGSIKFTFEEEDQGKIPFLDTLLVRKEDGSVKLLVYRKKTHTDQYLDFQSQHPLHHKLGVIRTLMDRMENIVTEEQDKKEEEQRIRTALTHCGYPKWALDRVKQQIVNKPQKPQKSKPNKDAKDTTRGMVVIPYVESLTEKLQRIYRKHHIHAAVRPTNTLKSILVHPKDKKDITETSDVVYDVPCGGYDKSYVGETGRQFGTRLKEHQKDVTTVADVKFTRANRKASTTEQHKSAITDHVAQENHIINWDEAKILDRDSNTFSRRIREAIEIRKKGAKAINRDEGSFTLDHVYDSLLCTTSHPRKENNNKFPEKSSEPRHL